MAVKLLVVDDEKDILEFLNTILRQIITLLKQLKME